MKIKKFLTILIITIILLTNISTGYVKALTENETINLVKDHTCASLLKVKGQDMMKTVVYVYYRDANGQKYPAFCVEPEKDGIGMGAGDSYDVTVNQISDNVLWRMLYKGYMGTSYWDWGLECDDDLYYATKTAVHCMAENISPKEKYEIATRVGRYDNLSLEEVKRRSAKVLEVSQNIYDFGYSGTENYMKPVLNINKNGELVEETINGVKYIVQKYNITANKALSSYKVGIENFPAGSKIMDNNQNETSNMTNSNFKIAIPKNSITYNINGKIHITDAEVKTYPIFYANSKNPNTQDYVTYSVPNEKGYKTIDLYIDAYKSKIKIIKTDKETGERLAGIKFNAKYEDGTYIGEYVTNANGEISITKLKQGRIIITEIDSGKHYILDDTEHVIDIEYNEEISMDITNMHKKGNIKIIKVDKDNNDLTLGAVEFDLLNEKGDIVNHIITDVNGEAEIKDINTGNYILRETKTKREYKLAVDQDIIVEWNKLTEIKIENERKKGQIKIIKIDKDNEEIKLQGVKFEIIDKNNSVVETIVTNEQGEATTSRLPIGEYKVKEVSIGTNENYILNEEIKTIIIEEDKIKNIEFENEYKKGKLIIHKLDLDDKNIPIPNVEFEIIHEDGYKYYTKTDENGVAYVDNIRKGIIMIRETKTNEIYYLNDKPYYTEIYWNETEEIIIRNEKKKGQIEVCKIDAENNEIKLEGVEFQIINSKSEIVETIKTNEQGIATTSKLPIGEYLIKETKTDENHILKEETIKVNVDTDKVSKIEIENERIKGKIKVIKTSSDSNLDNTIKAGDPIPNVEFEVFDTEGKFIEKIITNTEGIAITQKLDKGMYLLKEVKTGEGFVLNESDYWLEIKENDQIIEINITNEPEKPDVKIEKTGEIQTANKEEIRYDFNIQNTGNTSLDNFTWYDYLPYEYVKINKIQTGTYNQNLNYNVYYKTNKNDYKLLAQNLNTLVINIIDLEKITLQKDEIITEIKFDFGTVEKGFKSILNSSIICNIKENVKDGDSFTNRTRIEGKNKDLLVWDEDKHTIIVKQENLIEKKLPRTGF